MSSPAADMCNQFEEYSTNGSDHSAVGRFLQVAAEEYKPYHGYVVLALVLVNSVFCIMNVFILNHPNMRSPTNFLLSCIAEADGLVMVTYAVYAINFCLLKPCALVNGMSYVDAGVLYWFIFFVSTGHCCSIWLAVFLAALRLSSIGHIQSGNTFLSRCHRRIIPIFPICSMAICSSTLITHRIILFEEDLPSPNGGNETIKRYVYNVQATSKSGIWVQAILVRLLPCFLLCVLSFGIVRRLLQHDSHRRRRLGIRDYKAQRTSCLLVAVAILFVTIEMPQGILLTVSIINHNFFLEIYNPLGDFLDLMTLVRTIANFLIYCFISRNYRDHIRRLNQIYFIGKLFRNKSPDHQVMTVTQEAEKADACRAPTRVTLTQQVELTMEFERGLVDGPDDGVTGVSRLL